MSQAQICCLLLFVIVTVCGGIELSGEENKSSPEFVQNLVSAIGDLTKSQNQLLKEVGNLRKELKKQETINSFQQEEISQLQLAIDKTEAQELHKRFVLDQSSGGVAFSSFLDADLDNLIADMTIPLDRVLLNDGDGYNSTTGVFTAPNAGVYLFSFFIATRHEVQIYVKLMVNFGNTVDAVADGYHAHQDVQGGNLAVLRLQEGDKVAVVVDGGSHLEGDISYRYTSFSGVLLYV